MYWSVLFFSEMKDNKNTFKIQQQHSMLPGKMDFVCWIVGADEVIFNCLDVVMFTDRIPYIYCYHYIISRQLSEKDISI